MYLFSETEKADIGVKIPFENIEDELLKDYESKIEQSKK